MNDVNLKRIADAMEEILRLVKKDQEESKKKWKYEPNEDGFMGSENRIESEQTFRASNGPSLPAACALAGGSGTKLQAASCKRQAASLTRLNYNVIQSYKLKENKQ